MHESVQFRHRNETTNGRSVPSATLLCLAGHAKHVHEPELQTIYRTPLLSTLPAGDRGAKREAQLLSAAKRSPIDFSELTTSVMPCAKL